MIDKIQEKYIYIYIYCKTSYLFLSSILTIYYLRNCVNRKRVAGNQKSDEMYRKQTRFLKGKIRKKGSRTSDKMT